MPEQVRLFNRTAQPRVVAWGEGVVMPGESFLTDNPEGYAPNQPGSPWSTDDETSVVLSAQEAQAGDTSDSATEGGTGPQDASELPPTHMLAGADTSAMQGLKVEADGDVVNDAGQVVGHLETNPANPAEGGNA